MTGFAEEPAVTGNVFWLGVVAEKTLPPKPQGHGGGAGCACSQPTRDWFSGGQSSFRREFGAVRKCAPGHHWSGPTVSGGAWKVDPTKKKGCFFSLSNSLCHVWHSVLIDLRGRL